jgi:Fur family transcriptional regulator, peroxide stress response regulator
MSAKQIKPLSQRLKQQGHRFTRQRQIILEEVQKRESHPNATEIYEAVRQRIPNISLGTVYRGLGLLVELGLIRRLEQEDCSRFDSNLSEHYHIICNNCKQIFDIDTSILEKLNTHGLEAEGFEINGLKLELHGLCPSCGNAAGV